MSHWTDRREGGSRFWLLLIRWTILHIGRGFALLGMYPTTLYFFLRRGPERRASRDWLARATNQPAGRRRVLRHIFTFATTIVDRVLLLAGRTQALHISAEGLDGLNAVLRQGRGCLLLGSHLGSFEAIRVFSTRSPEHHLKVLMDRQQNALMTSLMESLNPGVAATVIDARQAGTSIVLAIQETLAAGDMVAMLADRAHRHEPVVGVPFMGDVANFPGAPMLIAATLDVPVYLVFGLFEGGNRYRLVFESLAERVDIPRGQRRERLQHWVAHYAGRLEHYARAYPYNWFNFYDFWQSDATGHADADDDQRRRPGRGTA